MSVRTARVCLLTTFLIAGVVLPAFAQIFGGIVYDPTNYANALLRYDQLRQQYTQLVTMYQQMRTEYQLLKQQAELLPYNMYVRYQTVPTPWLPFSAAQPYGTTTSWVAAANTGLNATGAFARATQPLISYGGAIGSVPSDEASRIQRHYDRVNLTDASITHALEALGSLRGHQTSVETTLRNLETDTFSRDPSLNTQIATLNKIGATAVTSARLAKDANNVLVSLLEQQILEAADRRDATVQSIDAHIAFLNEARALLARSTADTTTALTTFRIP